MKRLLYQSYTHVDKLLMMCITSSHYPQSNIFYLLAIFIKLFISIAIFDIECYILAALLYNRFIFPITVYVFLF